ncbi:hypothetical protein H0Z60_00755 [Ectothiorhodospiraceae bacterium WFHF3C12]|nr:hypothetical protein [Ectothiorhodospiraceae bacterium WFHF3C12]
MSRALPVTSAYSLTLAAEEAPVDLGAWVSEATEGQRFRRINRFIQLALIGAHRCRQGDAAAWRSTQPIVIATGQGNIADTTEMVESVVGRGLPPMPFQFINLAGNMAGFYLAQSLGAESANTTVSQLDFPAEAALQIAAEEHAGHGAALLGAVDELVWPLDAHRRRVGCPPDAPVGEGSHWLRIGDGPVLGWIEPPVYCADEAELEAVLQGAGVDVVIRTPGQNGGVPAHDTAAAAHWCGFLRNGPAGAQMAHVSAGADGRRALVRVTRAR